MELSINLELLYKDITDDIGKRAALAAEDGFRFVELWMLGDKDERALRRAFDDAGVKLWSLVVEPRTSMSTAPDLTPFYDGVKRSAERAAILGCPHIVASSGPATPAQKRVVQHKKVVEVLQHAAGLVEGTGVKLLLENVNTRVDHPGALLDMATECADIVHEVNSPSLAMLADLYHAAVMGEDLEAVMDRADTKMLHVQLAGLPGRAEQPAGAGNIWPGVLSLLEKKGYSGVVGLEYLPALPSRDSVKAWKVALGR
jgi:hydroxypyruvate isomerase